ncbi:MAG: OmpH family outer membrane protein [Fimbriimonadales bacterium]|nr:OmpH family outer membrane protein [Fimbriimonadales bacterium]
MSNRISFANFGWLVAAALAGALFAGGFQGSSEKIGVVDIAKVIGQSNIGKRDQETFNQMKAAREGLLEFIDTYRVLTNEQAQRIKELSLLPNPKPEEKNELERLKAEVRASNARSTELATKTNPTPEDRALMDEFARRSQTMEQVAQRWYREFTNELQQWADKQKAASIEKAKAAIQEVAKSQGFTVVFEAGIAPYGANDLNEAVLRALNARN